MSKFSDSVSVIIAADAALSGAIRLGSGLLCAIQMPAAWNGTEITFDGTLDGSTYLPVFDEFGNESVVAVGVSRIVQIELADFGGLRLVKIRSGRSAAPVAQAAQREILMAVRSVQ
jgi:predicted acylesterase/phospholipase RssA